MGLTTSSYATGSNTKTVTDFAIFRVKVRSKPFGSLANPVTTDPNYNQAYLDAANLLPNFDVSDDYPAFDTNSNATDTDANGDKIWPEVKSFYERHVPKTICSTLNFSHVTFDSTLVNHLSQTQPGSGLNGTILWIFEVKVTYHYT